MTSKQLSLKTKDGGFAANYYVIIKFKQSGVVCKMFSYNKGLLYSNYDTS